MTPQDFNPYASPAVLEPPPNESAVIFTQGRLATLWQRFFGALIDSLIALPLVFTVSIALATIFAAVRRDSDTNHVEIAAKTIGRLLGVGSFVAVHGYLLATRGQTIGKYLLKTQIVSDDGELVHFWLLIIKRYLPIWMIVQFPLVGPLFWLADSLAILRADRKCFHDQIAGTKVIQIE